MDMKLKIQIPETLGMSNLTPIEPNRRRVLQALNFEDQRFEYTAFIKIEGVPI